MAALRAAGYRVAAAQARPPDLPWAARPSCWHSNRSGRFGMPLYMQTCGNQSSASGALRQGAPLDARGVPSLIPHPFKEMTGILEALPPARPARRAECLVCAQPPGPRAIAASQVDWSVPTAVVFGNEREGDPCDGHVAHHCSWYRDLCPVWMCIASGGP